MARSISEWESARQDAERIGKFFERLGKAQDVLRTAIAAEQEHQGLLVEIDQARGGLVNIQKVTEQARLDYNEMTASSARAEQEYASKLAALQGILDRARADNAAEIQASEDAAAMRLQHVLEQQEAANAELTRVTAEVDQQEQRLAGIRQQVAAMLQGGA